MDTQASGKIIRTLGLIPARGGSKGLPGKNVKKLGGKSLLQWAAEAATNSEVVDYIMVSTDSHEIAREAERCGIEVPFLRPSDIAGDSTPMVAVIAHAIEQLKLKGLEPDIIFLLQPTSPFRSPTTLQEAAKLLDTSHADSVVSVSKIPAHLSPHYAMRIDGDRLVSFLDGGEKFHRRQDVPPAYVRNGDVYAFRNVSFQHTGSIYGNHSVPIITPYETAITIDTPLDWSYAEWALAAGLIHRGGAVT